MNINSYLEEMFSLKDKVVMFTGAGGGIGSEVAMGMAKAGAHVALCDISMEQLSETQKNIENINGKATSFLLDVANMDNIQECVDEVAKINGRIDVLVNCAGINKREGLADVDEATYDRIMNINLKGVFFLSQAVANYMKKQNSGSIINIGSHNTGWILGGCSVYGATKAGIVSLTKSMSVEWAKYNIRANCVSPGHIKTALTTATWEHPERSKYLLDRIAMNRPGYPEDITGVCLLLASDASKYITGCEYRVDGGCMSGGQPWPYDTNF